MPINEENKNYLLDLTGRPLSYQVVTSCFEIWKVSRSRWTKFKYPSRLGHENAMSTTWLQVTDMISRFPDDVNHEDELTPEFVAQLAAVIDYRDASESGSAKTEKSSTNQIFKALLTTSTMQQHYFGRGDLTVVDQEFIAGLSNRAVTYGDLVKLGQFTEGRKTKQFSNVVFSELSLEETTVAAVDAAIQLRSEDADDDETISAGVRGTLLDHLRGGEGSSQGAMVQSLLRTTTLFSCVTVDERTAPRELDNWLKKIIAGMKQVELSKDTVKTLHETLDMLRYLAIYGDVFVNRNKLRVVYKRYIFGEGIGIPVHLEAYDTKGEAKKGLKRLVVTIIQIYQQANEHNMLAQFYQKFDCSGYCIEGRTHYVIEWAGKYLNDNKLFPVATPEFSYLMENAYLQALKDGADSQRDYLLAIGLKNLNLPCLPDDVYAPDGFVTLSGIQKYLEDVLHFDDTVLFADLVRLCCVMKASSLKVELHDVPIEFGTVRKICYMINGMQCKSGDVDFIKEAIGEGIVTIIAPGEMELHNSLLYRAVTGDMKRVLRDLDVAAAPRP